MWVSISDSVAGTSHEASNTPCQDSSNFVKHKLGDEEILIAAVADGAGCASKSHIGSHEAVQQILKTVTENITSLDLTNYAQVEIWFKDVQFHLLNLAISNSNQIGDYASTLLLAIIWRSGGIFAQVGDGAWVVENSGSLEAVTWPDTGEYANVTFFITTPGVFGNCNFPNQSCHLQFRRIEGAISAVAGFTDGLQSIALDYSRKIAHEPFFNKLFSPLKATRDETELIMSLRKLLTSEIINSKTDDDKTLFLSVWRETT